MAVVGAIYLVVPNVLLDAFFGPSEHAARAVAGNLLVVAAALQFLDCAQNIGVGLLAGIPINAMALHAVPRERSAVIAALYLVATSGLRAHL